MMSKLFYLSAVCVLVAIALPARASISYEANQSFVSASYMYQPGGMNMPMGDSFQNASGFGPMSVSASQDYGALLSGSAHLTGSFTDSEASAMASLLATNSCANQWGDGSGIVSGSAQWDFIFNLTDEQVWTLTGTTGMYLQGSSIVLYGFDSNGDTVNVFFKDIGFASSQQIIDESGTLDAGRYWLSVSSQLSTNVPYSYRTSGFDLTFAVAATPEPATLGLVVLGVAAMMRRR